jgi:K+-transporting ATPase ATPase B chain
VVAEGARVLGVVQLKDIVKGGIRERFAEMRRMGIRTVMITGDNPLTAAAIAAEAGVDDFLAEATPEAKLAMIRRLPGEGPPGRHDRRWHQRRAGAGPGGRRRGHEHRHAGGQRGRQHGRSRLEPDQAAAIVEIGKQMLMTRGALTTFSIANDVAKYFAIIPAAFVATYPALGALNVMGLHSPASAILSAVIFNALIIVALIPLALRGMKYRPRAGFGTAAAQPARVRPRRRLLPFPCIKLIDLALTALGVG